MRVQNVLEIFQTYAIAGAILIFPALLIFLFLRKTKRPLNVGKAMIWGSFFCYLFIVMGATLFYRSSSPYRSAILQPFMTYRLAWHASAPGQWRNLMMNIMMFIPIGFMLPLLSIKTKNFLTVASIGFLMTVSIETAQFFTGRGGFAVDDIINNTLGALIGFGIYKVMAIRPFSVKEALKWLSPLLITLAAFSGIFIAYELQELGNLQITPVFRQNMNHIAITSEIAFSQEARETTLFSTTGLVTRSETERFASEFFKNRGVVLAKSATNSYDRVIIYRGIRPETGQEYSLWVERLGLAYWFSDFSSFDLTPLANVEETIIREALSGFGIQVPSHAQFTELENGRYQFTATAEETSPTFHGTLRLQFFNDYSIRSISNQMLRAYPLRTVEIISEETAFQQIQQGLFGLGPWHISSLRVVGVELDWLLDSKGFLQPVYRFQAWADDWEHDILIPAMK